jgi:hypothetical protein
MLAEDGSAATAEKNGSGVPNKKAFPESRT